MYLSIYWKPFVKNQCVYWKSMPTINLYIYHILVIKYVYLNTIHLKKCIYFCTKISDPIKNYVHREKIIQIRRLEMVIFLWKQSYACMPPDIVLIDTVEEHIKKSDACAHPEKQNTLTTIDCGTYFFYFVIFDSKSVILLRLCLVFVFF